MFFEVEDEAGEVWEVAIDVDIRPFMPLCVHPTDETFDYDERLRWLRLIGFWKRGETKGHAIEF